MVLAFEGRLYLANFIVLFDSATFKNCGLVWLLLDNQQFRRTLTRKVLIISGKAVKGKSVVSFEQDKPTKVISIHKIKSELFFIYFHFPSVYRASQGIIFIDYY